MDTKMSTKRGISPVIATVILVAVAITVSVAVAYWMSGIAGQYTQFEKVEIQSGYATKVIDPDPLIGFIGWDIKLELKNSGTSTATLVSCFINEKIIGVDPFTLVTCISTPNTGTIGQPGSTGITIDSGKSSTITISMVPKTFTSSGTTLNVKIHSAAGMDYIRLIQLP